MSDSYLAGFVGPLSFDYGVPGRASALTLKVVNSITGSVYYAASNAAITEAETGLYTRPSFTYPSVLAPYRSAWYDTSVYISGSANEFRIDTVASDVYPAGFIGPLSFDYGITGLAASLTIKAVNSSTGATYYAASGSGIAEVETGLYSKASFAFPSVIGTYRSAWYNAGAYIDGSADEFIVGTPTTPPTASARYADVMVTGYSTRYSKSVKTRYSYTAVGIHA